MSKRPLGVIALTILLAFVLAGVSCNRGKPAPKLSPMQEELQKKLAEARQKSFETSRNVTVAKVNGVNITMFDLINEMNTIAPEYAKPQEAKDPKRDAKVRKTALDRLVDRELAVQEAERQGLKAAPEGVAAALKKIKAGLKTEDAYQAKLKQSGITEEDLKKQLARNILVDMITEKEIFDKVKIDPNEVKKVYEKNKASYKGPSGQMSFEEARPMIEEKLMTPLVQKREAEWVKGLTKAAKIEITLGESAKEIHSVK